MALAVPEEVEAHTTSAIPRRRGRRIRTLSVIAAPLLAAALATQAVGVAQVVNDSMDPTLHNGQLVVYDRWIGPFRGDIVLFRDTEGWSGSVGAPLIKRVVGVAGDTVVCCEAGSGRLLVNGDPIDEAYITGERPGGVIPFRVSVPEGAIWVVGDNRGASVDSRSAVSGPRAGAIDLDHVLGTVRGWMPGHTAAAR